MLPLSLFQDIVYIPGMWIKVAVTSGTALPPGDYSELWLTLPNVALTDSPCGMVTVRALPGLGVPASGSHGKGKGGFHEGMGSAQPPAHPQAGGDSSSPGKAQQGEGS